MTESVDILRREEGYTLVETLVALVLFTSVAIPLGVSVGTLLLDRRAEKLQRAVLLAQQEVDATVASGTFSKERHVADGKYLVRREIVLDDRMLEIHVAVSTVSDSSRALYTLNKTLLNSSP